MDHLFRISMSVYVHASLRVLTAPLFVRWEKTRRPSQSRSAPILANSLVVGRYYQCRGAGCCDIFTRAAGRRFRRQAVKSETGAGRDAAPDFLSARMPVAIAITKS